MSEKILLIDGHSILNRAFYGLPDLTNAEGRHTGAVYGFLNIMFRIMEEEKPEYLTVAFDLSAPTFRHKRYEAYKGTRKPMPEELREQVPLIKEMLSAMGINIMSLEGYEADDLLGTVARRSEAKGMDVTILSGDRDLLQLATDKVLIRLPKTVRGKTTIENYHTAEVLEKYQVTPPQIIELKALMGDSSDNIPGIPGVGEKTATKMIVQFGSIENAHEHLEEVKPNKAKESLREHYDMAQLSKELATINTDSPLEFSYEKAKVENPYTPEAYELCKRLEFKNMLNRFDPATAADSSMELEFFTCNDLSGVEALFEKAGKKDQVGISVLADQEEVYSVGLVLDENEIYQIPVGGLLTGEYLCTKIEKLAQETVICAMDIKAALKHVALTKPEQVFDAGIAAYLLNPLKSSYTHDDMAREYLNGMMLPAKEDLLGKTSLKKAWEDEMEGLGNYACYQAFVPYMAREELLRRLDETGMRKVYDEIELPLVFTLDSMEKWGIAVKGEELKSYGEKLSVRIQELEKTIWQEAGEEFNINSPKQLGVILFEKLGLPGGKKTKTGYSTAADILDKLAPEHVIVKDILEYRQLTKLKSTYADGLGNVIGKDGRIHSTFNQTITATGRISSTEPNLQNIPVRMELGRLIRKVFVPEDGYVFLDADYSQIELRVLAHMSGDEKLIQAYREAEDIHRLTASQVFHVPLDEVTPLQRRNAKAVNFGIVYGISSFGLSQDLSITRKEAAAYIEKYFETYPKIKGFLDGLVKDGKEYGYVTTMFGRRRPVPELKSSNFMQRSFGERVAMNSPIQGTAADIIKIAMNHVYERMKKEGLQSRLVLQVHDELLIETKKEEIEEVSRILEEEMTGAAELKVELDVDMHQGDNWYEAK
ncbi:DNA polymerase I [Blautia sp. CLA-JM-H16]|uniref:DNA polymerase I n=1 Tax=Blautia aquisgranensis TaxID=3133153 RepID=A0ABV1BEE5_9FIRM